MREFSLGQLVVSLNNAASIKEKEAEKWEKYEYFNQETKMYQNIKVIVLQENAALLRDIATAILGVIR